jgi:nicotinate-nucleotide pyrophosphorylase
LPYCSPDNPKLKVCKDRETWTKVKAAEAAATQSIEAAEATLLGDELDPATITEAMNKIEIAKSLILEAPGGAK